MASVSENLCAICQQPIPAERLRSLPHTQYCVICQDQLETGHDTKRYIDEGIAGSRKDHQLMKEHYREVLVERWREK